MGKSVYSIVLTDEVVDAVDKMAYGMNTSRSNLIDMILAEKVSYTTPEMRVREIFSLMEQLLDGRFLPSSPSSGSVMAVKTPLKFKYKPTVKYCVELFGSFSDCVGRLKVTLRTQSEELIRLTEQFFVFWSRLEGKYLGEEKISCGITPKCYVRDFRAAGEERLSDRAIAEGISGYIRAFDKAMSAYFDNIGDSAKARELCEGIYVNYLKGDNIVI